VHEYARYYLKLPSGSCILEKTREKQERLRLAGAKEETMYKCVALDVDGTLINTEQAIFHSLGRVLKEELGREFTTEEMEISIGMLGEHTMALFNVPDPAGALKRWYAYLDEARGMNTLYPGVELTVRKLKEAGYTVAVVTSRKRFEMDDEPLLEPLRAYFDEVVTADLVEAPKPHPAPLLRLMERQGLKAEEILFVGDTIHDSRCAQNAGVDFVLAGWGARYPETIPSLHDLMHPYEIAELIFCHGKSA